MGDHFFSVPDMLVRLQGIVNSPKSRIAYLRLVNTSFEAGVNLAAATIEGNLECLGSQFASKGELWALQAPGAKIKGSAFLSSGFKAEGEVSLQAATIEGDLLCIDSRFNSSGEIPALSASAAKIKGSVYLRQGFKAEGGVDFRAATIEGSFSCIDAQFAGGVNLQAATIERDLECRGSQFAGKGEILALDAFGTKIQGKVLLCQGFMAEGEVRFGVATIQGDLVCEGSQFVSNGQEYALDANGANIGGSVLLRNRMTVEGEVCFSHAHVARNFQWCGVESPKKAILNLGSAKVGRLLNEKKSWPNKGNLFVGGFVYDQIDDRAPQEAKVQLEWLNLQKRDKFLPQPYEQLAAVFRERGLEEDTRQVMIEKNKEHGRYLQRHLHMPSWDWRPLKWVDWFSRLIRFIWYRYIGNIVVGYGYRPGRAFILSLVVIVAIGWPVFKLGHDLKLITPTRAEAYVVEKDGTRRLKNSKPQVSEDYPKFNAFVYSVETFVPLLKLGISESWTPNANRGAPYGSLLCDYLSLHIVLGWVLTTLWIGALAGLVKT